MKTIKRLLIALVIAFSPLLAHATHIVGGEMNYSCLGNSQYEITLTIFRDCYNGNPAAWFDNPAAIGVFDQNNFLLATLFVPLDLDLNDTLDPVLSGECFVAPPDVCVHTTTYTTTVLLPPIPGGYQLAYQRCCRNQTIVNIVDPLATGATYGVTISEEALAQCNSNPKFNSWPPIYICVDEPINFDQSAQDIDGDSIVYKLCTPLQGADPDNPQPQPPHNPPYDEIVWVSPPYGVDNMLNGTPGDPLQIDLHTGLLTGTPNTIGQFVVGICVEEYRDGELISTTRRDFQYNVGVCGMTVSSFFAPEFQCDDLTVQFENQSEDADEYLWIFNDPNNPITTSNAENPSFTFQQPGTYEVMLVADPETVCADTFSQTITLALNGLNVDFDYEIVECVDNFTIQMTDLTTDSNDEPVAWDWQVVGTNLSSNEQNPSFTLANSNAVTIMLTVTSGNGCMESHSLTLTDVGVFDVAISSTDILCNGDNNGTADVTASGGAEPYTYLWSNGEETASISDLASGTYTVTVTAANGCEQVVSTTVEEPSLLASMILTSYTSCDAPNSGQLEAVVTGGTGDYTYLWSNDETTATISNLPGGAYSVTVTDENGCTAVSMASVFDSGEVVVATAISDVTCNGDNDGSIDLSVSGGLGDYTYQWSNNETTEDLSNLGAGTYTVTVSDAGDCSTTVSITIDEPAVLDGYIMAMDAGCMSGTDPGGAMAGAMGGTPPYSFVWNNGETTSSIENLTPGEYSVTITDANGCVANASTVVELYNLAVEISGTDLLCAGDNSGAAVAVASGGVEPYMYLWSNDSTEPNLSGLSAGTYGLTVTDGMGCTTMASVSINTPSLLNLTTSSNNVSCFGVADGDATATVSGGTPPYSYLWDTGSTEAFISTLLAGNYGLTVMDANGCSESTIVSITQPTALTINTESTNVVCFGEANGTASVSASGSVPPYNYVWSNGSTSTDISGLAPGTYDVTVTDENGCLTKASLDITEPSELLVNLNATEAVCAGDGNGEISSSVSGGTLPYSYAWSTGSDSDDISGLEGGTYILTVTDGNGCVGTATANIATLETPVCNINVLQHPTYLNADNGQAQINVTGGTAPYTYLWSNGADDEILTNLRDGTYSVTVTDANGCSSTCEAMLNEPPAAKVSNYVWHDYNQNGLQDFNEFGMLNITILIEGTDLNGDHVLTGTTSNADGYYAIDNLNAGTYELTFISPTGYELTHANMGDDDAMDSDPNPETGQTASFILEFGDCLERMDAGFHGVCAQVTEAGEIGYDQQLCHAGEVPEELVSLSMPSGGFGEHEFIWMQASLLVPFTNSAWEIIPGATEATYQPEAIYATTYYARCVRSAGCFDYEESNVVKVDVGPYAVAVIYGPEEVCVGEEENFSATPTGDDATFHWDFGDSASPSTATGQHVSTTWNTTGNKTVVLTVMRLGCSISNSEVIHVSDHPSDCGPGWLEGNGSGVAGVNANIAQQYIIYPNPFEETFVLETSNSFENDALVEVLDLQGRRLFSKILADGQTQLRLDMTAYAAGIYFVKVPNAEGESELLRVIKQ